MRTTGPRPERNSHCSSRSGWVLNRLAWHTVQSSSEAWHTVPWATPARLLPLVPPSSTPLLLSDRHLLSTSHKTSNPAVEETDKEKGRRIFETFEYSTDRAVLPLHRLPLVRERLLESSAPSGSNHHHNRPVPQEFRNPVHAVVWNAWVCNISWYYYAGSSTSDQQQVRLFRLSLPESNSISLGVGNIVLRCGIVQEHQGW